MKYEVTASLEIIHDSVQKDEPCAGTLVLLSEHCLRLPTSR